MSSTEEAFIQRRLSTSLASSVDTSWCWTDTSDIKANLSVKIKTQLMAKKFVFKILLITIIAASAELALLYPKDNFVVKAFRHFAMVFHIDYSANTSILSASGGGPVHSSSANNLFCPLLGQNALMR